MSDWNEAKLQTLEDAYASGEITSSDLADIRGLTLHAASNRLKRYHRQGLFRREKNGKKYFYNITVKGIARIDWLREKKTTKKLFQEIAAKRCPVKKEKNVTSFVEQEQSYSNSGMTPESMILKYSDKRCPFVRPRNLEPQDSVDLNEEYEDEEDYIDTDAYDNIQEEDEINEASLFSNIQRCRINKKENDPISAQDLDEEEEDIDDIFQKYSEQRCKINNNES